jgi:hypothetical protein
MNTLTVDRAQPTAQNDQHDRTNPELRVARGMLWAVAAGGVLWCLIGLAVWFGVH